MAFNISFLTIVIALVLLTVSFLAYRRTTPPVSPRLRVFLTGLRVLSFLLIVFLLMDPRYVLRAKKSESAEIAVLVDRSASMSLPAASGGAQDRFDAALSLARRLKQNVEDNNGVYSEFYFSGADLTTAVDSLDPGGQGTDIRAALAEAFKRFEGRNLTGMVVVSDGVDTEERLIRQAVPGVPVYTVGVGDTVAPEDVRIKDVDYNSVVRVPSQSLIRATVDYTGGGGGAKQIRMRLMENGRVVFEKDTLIVGPGEEITQEIGVDFREEGRRNFVLDVDVRGYDAEPENNRREIVIEGEKAGVNVLVVDQRPAWELRFLSGFLRKDQTFDFDLVSVVAQHPSLDDARIVAPGDFVRRLREYDALVLISVERGFINDPRAEAMKRFVRTEGKGLLVLPGSGSLFERPDAWNRLSDILPVRANPPLRFQNQYTIVRPGPQAMSNPMTTRLVPRLSQTDWQQRSPLLGHYSPVTPKPGAEILLETEGTRAPAMVSFDTGGGRVALIAAGPIWRWGFLAEDGSVYDDLMSRMLDFLARGGETERFVLKSKKNVYDSGETAILTAEIFNEKMQPVTGAPVRVEVSRVGGNGEVPLDIYSMRREGSDNPRFRVSLPPLPAGRYRLRGEADLPGRTIVSQPIDVSVSEVSVEFQRVDQDRNNLASIARKSGGMYVDAAGAERLHARISLEPRVTDVTSEMSLRTSVIVFVSILVLLSIEWIIRKRVGMI